MRLLLTGSLVALLGALPVAWMAGCVGQDSNPTTVIVNNGDDAGAGDGGGGGVPDSSTPPSDSGTGSETSSEAGTDAGGPVTGDVVVLNADTIQVGSDGNVTKWANAVAGSTLVAVTSTASKPTKIGNCVAFSQTQLMVMVDDGTLNPGTGDFSVTAVLSTSQGAYPEFGQVPIARTVGTDTGPQHDSFRGWALYAWYQPAMRSSNNVQKFAGRLDYNLNVSSVEAVDPVIRDSDTMYGVAMFRRGDDIYLAVNDQVTGHGTGANNVAQPSSSPLLIGKSDDDDDFAATVFEGQICGIVVHHGAETDVEILTRIALMRAGM